MKKIQTIILACFVLTGLLSFGLLDTGKELKQDLVLDSLEEDRAKYLKQVRESIKGRGKKASDSVFKNIKILKGMPAGRLLAIMDIGYSQSLGVSCGHCHNTDHWESDEKPQKQVAREMSLMLNSIKERLKTIKGLKSENPIINCTTCHQGSVKPLLDLKK